MGGGKKNQSSSTATCNVSGIHTLHEFRSKPTAESIRVRIPRFCEKMSTPTLLNILTKEISSKLCSIGFTFWGFDQSIWFNYFKNFRRRKPKISSAKKHDPPQLKWWTKKLGNGWLTSLCSEKQFCPSAIDNKKSHARSSSSTEILRNHPRPRDAPHPQRSMQNRPTPLHSSRASGHGV